MWGLSSLTRDQTCICCLARQSPNHWNAREVNPQCVLIHTQYTSLILKWLEAMTMWLEEGCKTFYLWKFQSFQRYKGCVYSSPIYREDVMVHRQADSALMGSQASLTSSKIPSLSFLQRIFHEENTTLMQVPRTTCVPVKGRLPY